MRPKTGGSDVPADDESNGRPGQQIEDLAEHDEQHHGRDFPPRHLVSFVEVVRHRALADLLAEERDDVGAGPNRQDVPVPYGLDEPGERLSDDERIDQQVETGYTIISSSQRSHRTLANTCVM